MHSMTTVLHHVRRLAFQPGTGAPTDGQLLDRFLDQRDETAFEELLRRHGPMVLGVCRRLLGSGPDADDAFQATFLVLVRKAAAIVPREMVGNWLYGVAHRTALEARTLVARKRAREAPMDPLHEPAAPAENVWHEVQPLLDTEVSRLPPKYRAPVVLCDLEGKTQKEAARQLGWPEGTVSGRLFRARSLLAQRLRRHGLVLSAGSLAGLLTEHATAAAMPPVLIESTIQAAGVFAGGSAAAAGIVSAQVTTLAQGVMKTMWISQVKLITAVVLSVSVVGGGTGVLTQQALTGEPAAQTASAQGAEQREQGRQRPSEDGRRPEGPTLLPPGILERLDLTAEQKEKIAKLEKEFQEKIAPAKKKLDDAIEQAKQNQDRQKAQEAQEAFRKEVGVIQRELADKVGQLLTEEQRRRVEELLSRQRGGPPFDLARILGQLDLTAEQKEKVEKWMKEVGEKHEAAKKKLDEAVEQAKQNQDREKVRELFQAHEKEMAKLHEELLSKVQGILTDEQKRKFAEVQQRRRPEGNPPAIGHILPPPLQDRLGLTQEQKEKVAKLQKETEAKLKEILNEEQNKKLDELKNGPAERPRQRE